VVLVNIVQVHPAPTTVLAPAPAAVVLPALIVTLQELEQEEQGMVV